MDRLKMQDWKMRTNFTSLLKLKNNAMCCPSLYYRYIILCWGVLIILSRL